jgi:HSP20 family protein
MRCGASAHRLGTLQQEEDMAEIRRASSSDLMRPFFDTFFEHMVGPMRMPETDVTESENEIHVAMEIPGMRPEDINVELENNVLTISGEKKEEHEEREAEGRFHLSERRWGVFTRSFVLPREVQGEQIHADYDSGVLTIRIPKAESARRRRIDVSSSDQGQRVDTSKTGGTR